MTGATQQCPDCGSPLRPCRCEREAKVRRWNSTVPARKNPKRQGRRKTAAEKRAEWCRKYGSERRVKWTKLQPSIASGKRPCVNAHVHPDEGLPSGTSRKAGYRWIVPLTAAEHRELDDMGHQRFEARHGLVLADEAREHQRRWEERQQRDPRVRQ